MFERALGAVREQVDGMRAHATVVEIARHHRIQATPGYDAAAAWIRARLERLGVEVEVDEAPGDGRTRYLGAVMPEGWSCAEARAWLHAEEGRVALADFGLEPLSLVQRSAPGAGTFPLAMVPDGAEEAAGARPELRGRVVLTRGPAMLAHERWVVGEGAAGLLCDGRRLFPPVRTAAHDRDSLTYTSFWWEADAPRGWGFVLSPARADALRARLAAGEALSVEVRIESKRFVTPIPLVSGVLPGSQPGEVLLTAHLCHPRPGANDNGSGVAAALEALVALAALRARGTLPTDARSIRVLFVPELTGTFAWLGRDATRASRTQAALNLDMVGERQDDCGSTLLIEHPPHALGSFAEELLRHVRHGAQDWVSGFSGPGHYSLARLAEVPYSGGSDHMVWIDPSIGVPCPMLIQWPDRYYHSSLDTPERVDPASLALAARTGASYAMFLATAGEREVGWLLMLASRGAKRRLLAALDRGPQREGAEAERLRGQSALASVARLLAGRPPEDAAVRRYRGELALAVEDLEGFFESEIAPQLAPAAAVEIDHRVPERVHGAPLELLRHLMPGWQQATPATREAWRTLERGLPSASTVLDVAWYACDGVRTVGDIAATVRREGWGVTTAVVGRFFELAARLGLARLHG